jgi:hypothetical protein
MASRAALGGHLAERDWMTRVLDETRARMDELATVQRYPFPVDVNGRPIRNDLQGPEYMRRQRNRVQRLGVRILDHTPALELLIDDDGVVSGAVALDRRTGRPVRIEAGAVVLAAGGCAFQSKTLGCDVNTGDGALMAVEAGAVLSGMEFSNSFAIAPKGTSLTKTAYYSWATFYRSDRRVIEGAGSARGRTVIARTLRDEPVFARIDRASEAEQAGMRKGQPNFFLVFDRLGIDPFRDFFEITLVAEGTVRGTGGVRVTGYDCGTDVPGLYAAGDTATRELICGGFTGGGSHNRHGLRHRAAGRERAPRGSRLVAVVRPPHCARSVPRACAPTGRSESTTGRSSLPYNATCCRTNTTSCGMPTIWARPCGRCTTPGRSCGRVWAPPAKTPFGRGRRRRWSRTAVGCITLPCSAPKPAACTRESTIPNRTRPNADGSWWAGSTRSGAGRSPRAA